MKILLAAASFASNISGVQRHALNLVRCLLLRPEISTVHLVVAPWQLNLVQSGGLPSDVRLRTHIAAMNRGSFSRNQWYYRDLPKLAAHLRADVVHLTYPVPLNSVAFTSPVAVTLHDLYPYEIPRNFGSFKSIFNRMVLQQCLRQADAIACVSEATLSRLRQYLPASVWQKATRINNCVETGVLPARESPIPGWNGEPFLLSIAQHRRNKNLDTLIRAFNCLLRSGQIVTQSKLVVVGIRGPETKRIHKLVNAFGFDRRIHFLEGISEPELQWCYQHCEALVAPSLTEGFGLPVAEGLLAGCRVVCSDIPAHREIADGRCRFVALYENVPETLATAIAAALSEPKGPPVSLPQFAAPILANEYLALYREMIAGAASSQTANVGSAINIAASERQPL